MGSAFVRRIIPGSRRRAVLYNAGPTPPPGAATDLTGTATYYVDSVAGLDTNNGTSTATPKKTLAAVPTLSTGGTIALKAGSEFREAIPVVHTGTSGTPIVWGMYGTGTRPKIKGSKDYGSAQTWTLSSGSIYQAAAASLPTANLVFVDETVALRKYATLAALQAGVAGGFFADTANSLLYVWMPDGSAPTGHRIEVNGVVGVGMNTPKAYTTLQDLQIMHNSGNNSCIFSASANTNIIVQRCIIGYSYGTGVFMASPNMTVQDCFITSCWDGYEYPSSSANGNGITTSSAVTNSSGMVARRNWVTNCYYAIRPNVVTSMDVYLNYVYLNHVNGIDVIGASAAGTCRVVNNTVWHRPTGATPAGHAVDQQLSGTGGYFRNNLVFTDFTGSGATNVEAYCLATGSSANTSEDYELGWIDPASTGVYGKVGSTTYSTAAAYWAATQASYGAATNSHSINADPKFVSLGGSDPRLTPGSPAIGAGVAVTGITDTDTVDFTASPPNLGAFQTVATAVG